MISPTGLGIRVEASGDGHFGASRKTYLGTKYTHKGLDFACDKIPGGHPVVAPFDLHIDRISKPNDSYLTGIAFSAQNSTGRMWYFKPFHSLIGKDVEQGKIIGYSQELQTYYGPKVSDHIHFQFNSFNPEIFLNMETHLRVSQHLGVNIDPETSKEIN